MTAGRPLIEQIDRLPASGQHRPDLNIGLLLWPEFPLLSLSGLVDALRHAADVGDNSQKLRCNWSIMAPDPRLSILSSAGVNVRPDEEYRDPGQFDYVAVIGGLVRSLASGPAQGRAYLRRAREAKIPLIGICTGSFILAEESLLDGRRACLHSYHLAEFKERFPKVRAFADLDYVDDGDVLTCAGGISIITLTSELIRRHCGPDRATKVIHQMSVPNKADAAPVAVSQALGYTHVADPRLRRAVFLVEQSLVRPISLQWLANELNVSRRHLARMFDDEFGLAPAEFIRKARLRYGRWLLQNSSESVTEIALRIGFADCAHFIRMFGREYGVTPGALRKLN
ncbi:helix-turn-helix domain-containing protein [Novosphingobium sp.]|uniref:GlxA family transcriptional regulator n=1 Tax=Novosphingobium sp. TaxID=1874826 RepID=UPI0025FA63B6|nr:helix-turn-helix domain-containing protein [Novosphingobium sp.]